MTKPVFYDCEICGPLTSTNFTSEFRAWLARRGLTHAQAAERNRSVAKR